MSNQAFIFDANILIRLHRDLLPPDIWPSVWEVLRTYYCEGKWKLLTVVRDELLKGNDALQGWIRNSCFKPLPVDDEGTLSTYSDMMDNIIRGGRFTDTAISKYADGADPWIVAYAKEHDAVVVTLEKSAPNRATSIKIPDIAELYGVTCIDLNAYFRQPDIGLKY